MYGFKVRRQYGIENFIIDFYCPELKLAIEVDGDIHYLYGKSTTDLRKDNLLKSMGIKLIRLKNSDLEEDYKTILLYMEDIFRHRASELNIELKDIIG